MPSCLVGFNLERLNVYLPKVKTTFVKPHKKSGDYKASTLKSYLTSLIHFVDFVKLERVFTNISDADLNWMKEKVQRWNQSLCKDIAHETIERQIKDQRKCMHITTIILYNIIQLQFISVSPVLNLYQFHITLSPTLVVSTL